MKRTIIVAIALFLAAGPLSASAQAQTINERLKGRIILAVEAKGEAWYVDPQSAERYYLGRPADCLAVMRKLGLGISNADFDKMKGVAPLRLSGRILLKVQDKGQAYYVEPVTLKLHSLGRPADCFALMRSLGLGISNTNLNALVISKQSTLPGTGTTVVVTPPASTDNTTPTVQEPVTKPTPKISSIKLENGSDLGYLDAGDIITISFDRELDPKSIHADLGKGQTVNNVYFYATGGVSAKTDGLVTIKNIASFDLGLLERNADYPVKLALDSNGKMLTITLISGNDAAITEESYSSSKQIGGTIKDKEGSKMLGADITNPSGTFGGKYDENSGTPYISAIKVINNGDDGFIDQDDAIVITFNEAIDPKSINSNLNAGGSVSGIPFSSTAGIAISSTGKLTIKNIATFDLGSVANAGNFSVRAALNSTGKILTITISDGSAIRIESENFSDTNQTGATIKDLENKVMVTKLDIANPSGSFGGETVSDSEGPEIESITVADGGNEGYIDTNDTITIEFSEAIDPYSVNEDLESGSYLTGVASSQTGGVSVSSTGKLTIRNIAGFDMGTVTAASSYTVKLALDAAADTLTITITAGSATEISEEEFLAAEQIGTTIKDENGNAMIADTSITVPEGTFGGAFDDEEDLPYITAVKAVNGGNDGFIDTGDQIVITWNEAIDPESISMDLDEGSYISSVAASATGGVSVTSAGKITIKNIGYFDMGSVDNYGDFKVKIALNSTGKTLTITLTEGNDLEITNESFASFGATGATISDKTGHAMESDSNVLVPSGTFGN